MTLNIASSVPPEWKLLFQILTFPVAWIPPVQASVMRWLWDFSSPWWGALILAMFLLPALHMIAGLWCTMLAVYTVPFRAGRQQFMAAMLTTWWDSGRAVTLFWAAPVALAGGALAAFVDGGDVEQSCAHASSISLPLTVQR